MANIIHIEREESDEVEALLRIYEAHLHILHYLLKNEIDVDNKFIQQKFEDAIVYKTQLDMAKEQLNLKYCPNVKWQKSKVNFFNQTLEYW